MKDMELVIRIITSGEVFTLQNAELKSTYSQVLYNSLVPPMNKNKKLLFEVLLALVPYHYVKIKK